MSNNSNLYKAKETKNDEFYTRIEDIEKEMKHYKDHFKGKVVLCNCDDPEWSNFWKYFSLNFDFLGLKKIISTHYEKDKPSYKLEMTKKNKVIKTSLMQNGDFRSPECIEILKEADIVATNPPFSLFREYIACLFKYNKKMIILGNINAITCKDIFPKIISKDLWFGPSISGGDREFQVPETYPLEASKWRVDENGTKFLRVKGVRWFTNLTHERQNETLPLYKIFNLSLYVKYDNSNIIEVSKSKDIPCDYFEEMGVPITFLDKYNPKQFDIINLITPKINGKTLYKRIVIKRSLQWK